MLEILKLALRNLGRRKLRTALTILAVSLAIALTVSAMSVYEGYLRAIEETFEAVDIFVLPKGQTIMTLGEVYLPEGFVENLTRIKNVRLAFPSLAVQVPVGVGRTPIRVIGMPVEFMSEGLPYAELLEGRFPRTGERTLLLGYAAAKGADMEIHDNIPIGGTNFTVVGILKPFGDYRDNFAFAPLATLQEALRLENRATHFLVFVEDRTLIEETASEIGSRLDVSAYHARAVSEQVEGIMEQAKAIESIYYALTLLIGALFVFCIMTVTVTERTREIGVLRAIGATKVFIFKMFLIEAILIGLLGGAFGTGIGIALSVLYETLLGQFLGVYIEPVFPLEVIGTAFLIALAVGCLAGFYPAYRASRIQVVEALRYE